MAILREVLARFSVMVDDKPISKLDRRIEKVKANIVGFARTSAAVGLGVGYTMKKMVDAASSATENLNILTQTFDHPEQVVEWSKTMGKELGRSEFALQEYAGQFGSFLQPMLQGTGRDVAAMSEQLSTLAVDLASFYNTSDEEAMMRLRSGLAGETEAVRKLGIDLTDAGLSKFNESLGDKRGWRQISQAEKTFIRFQKILVDTERKQGDAKRTAQDYANSVRKLTDQWRSFMTRAGKKLEATAKRIVHGLQRAVDVIEALTLHTKALETALVLLAAGGLYKAAMGALAWQAAMVKAGKTMRELNILVAMGVLKVAALALGFLVFEDVWVLMSGGKSILGDYITIMTDIQKPIDVVNGGFQEMARLIYNAGVRMQNLAKIAGELIIGGPAGMVLRKAMTGEWTRSIDEGTIAAPDPAAQADMRMRMSESAATTGDLPGFKAAYAGSGRSDEQLVQMFKDKRRVALETKKAVPVQQDFESGLFKEGARGRSGFGNKNVSQIMAPINIVVDMKGAVGVADVEAAAERGAKRGLDTAVSQAGAALDEEVDQ